MEERRKAERKKTNCLFGVYHRETDEYIGSLIDMSTKGMMLLSERAMCVYTIYDFRIDLPESFAGKKQLTFDAECVWCCESTSSNTKYIAGFQITDIGSEEIEAIQYLLNSVLFQNPEEQPRVTLIEKSPKVSHVHLE